MHLFESKRQFMEDTSTMVIRRPNFSVSEIVECIEVLKTLELKGTKNVEEEKTDGNSGNGAEEKDH